MSETSQPAISETIIVNRALVRLGARPITSLSAATDDKSAAARVLYPELRDDLLRSLRWNFARKFVQLAQLTPQPVNLAIIPDPDYAGQVIYGGAYQLPNDYIRLSSVSPYSSHWRIVGRALYTDAINTQQNIPPNQLVGLQPPGADGADNAPGSSTAVSSAQAIGIEYIARIVDTTWFDPMFVRVLSLRLARDLCFGTNALESLRQQLSTEEEKVFNEARAIEGMEQWPEQLFDKVVVDVRYGYTSSAGSSTSLASG